jgi:hypothetical protein
MTKGFRALLVSALPILSQHCLGRYSFARLSSMADAPNAAYTGAQIWPYKADMLMRSKAGFGGVMRVPQNSKWKTRLVQHGFPDRSFDIEFWQEQGDEAIFSAAWEMVVLAEETNHGRKPRLQRSATTLKRV